MLWKNVEKAKEKGLKGKTQLQRWDCSQTENEEEEESWQEGAPTAEQWEVEQILEDIVETRRME